jgi:membrane-bound inhibitor of C-type lysozyme
MNRQPRAAAALSVVVTAIVLVAPPASAAEVTLMLDAPKAEALSVIYRCEGAKEMTVEYINAGEDSLAMVPVEGGRRLMVTVLSGSGARYAGGAFVWWTKGSEGSLYDLRNGEDADPVATCVEVE